ncbi:MAG: MBL fold metallo-hydrolase [Candidatus Micrarchaeaceae archaeon]
MAEIEWIGHASFLMRIKGKNVYVDPFNLKDVSEPADLILITHPHPDHFDISSINKVANESTQIFIPKDSAGKVPVGKVTGVEPNREYEALGVHFRTVPAYNVVKERLDKHPKKNGWVGYIIDVNGKSVYHAGDTDFIEEMKGLKVDVALLPMSGTYTMDVDQAIEAAKAIEAKQYTPMHYKMVLGRERSENAEKAFRSKVKRAVLLREIQDPSYSF